MSEKLSELIRDELGGGELNARETFWVDDVREWQALAAKLEAEVERLTANSGAHYAAALKGIEAIKKLEAEVERLREALTTLGYVPCTFAEHRTGSPPGRCMDGTVVCESSGYICEVCGGTGWARPVDEEGAT